MVLYDTRWYGMVGSIMLGDDNAAAKWESPASRRWSPDGQILFLGYRILSPDHEYLHHMTVLLSIFGSNIGVFFWMTAISRKCFSPDCHEPPDQGECRLGASDESVHENSVWLNDK